MQNYIGDYSCLQVSMGFRYKTEAAHNSPRSVRISCQQFLL